MNIEAVGAYLQRLRQKKELSRAQLATLVDVTETSLWRIESGKQEPRGTLLFALIKAVDGSSDDVQTLLFGADATVEDAELLAEEWWSKRTGEPVQQEPKPSATDIATAEQVERISSFLDDFSRDEIQSIMAVIQRIQTDPEKRKTLLKVIQSDQSTLTLFKLYAHAHERGHTGSKHDQEPIVPHPVSSE